MIIFFCEYVFCFHYDDNDSTSQFDLYIYTSW